MPDNSPHTVTRTPRESERDSAFLDYYRCPIDMAAIGTLPGVSSEDGYFRFDGSIGFGRFAGGGAPAQYATDPLPDASVAARVVDGRAWLPFDLSQVATNLRQERYRRNGYDLIQKTTSAGLAQRLYYLLRPLLGVGVRKHLQKIRLRNWEKIPFPQWPVDRTVDSLMEGAMRVALTARGGPVPFIWFWPDSAPACAMVTHDVEGQAGIDFCDALMDIDDSFGIKSAFQLIPEGHEATWRTTAERLRQRGFEVNLHDLNHDGLLFADKDEFLVRAERINRYAREFGCDGFRSGVMYREQDWFSAFEFSYDMSVPNAAHLEPQRGGCCTVMPYFVGDILELPLTTVQDYTLFHILNDYSTALWKRQIELISRHHGLISIISHPDYLAGERERAVYVDLLRHLSDRRARGLWMALPGEINRWWRNRRQMTLVADGAEWRIEGPDAERARVAYARLGDNGVEYSLSPPVQAARFA
jgi:hypothetical protein